VGEVIYCVFCTHCMVCLGRVVSWHHQDCNRQSMQRMRNGWSTGTELCQNTRMRI